VIGKGTDITAERANSFKTYRAVISHVNALLTWRNEVFHSIPAAAVHPARSNRPAVSMSVIRVMTIATRSGKTNRSRIECRPEIPA
jgi:hypothetical protein